MRKNLNTRIDEDLDRKIRILRDKHCINISQLIKNCLEEKCKEMKVK